MQRLTQTVPARRSRATDGCVEVAGSDSCREAERVEFEIRGLLRGVVGQDRQDRSKDLFTGDPIGGSTSEKTVGWKNRPWSVSRRSPPVRR